MQRIYQHRRSCKGRRFYNLVCAAVYGPTSYTVNTRIRGWCLQVVSQIYMARRRVVDPEFFLDDKLAETSAGARLLFIGVWLICDDNHATFPNKPKWIKAQIFPYDDVNIESMLKELEKVGVIIKFFVDDAEYFYVRNFFKYQKVDRPSTSKYPEYKEEFRRGLDEYSTRARPKVKISKDKLSKEKRSEEKSFSLTFLEKFNEVFGTKYTSTDPLVPNLEYWLKSYTIGQILQATQKAKFHAYWKDKLTPEILLRRKNPNGEMVDRIGEMLNYQIKKGTDTPDWLKSLPTTS